jgi:hypothetical protein
MKFGIVSDLRYLPRYAPHTSNFLKKKEKKKVVIQVKVSRKASFLEKILPEWVEIFSKTRRA